MFALILFKIFLVVAVNSQCIDIDNCVPEIPKCCGLGEVLVDHKCVSLDPVRYYNSTFGLNVGDEPVKKEFQWIPNKLCRDAVIVENFYLQNDGTLFMPETNQFLTVGEYCVDVNFDSLDLAPYQLGLWCYNAEDVIEKPQVIFSVGMIISIPFLLATFIAYALLPDRNLHMKALMFYVINLMSSYIILVVIQLSNSRFDDLICSLLGYFCLFFFLVSFLWMNVICFDIWFTFSGLRGFSGSKKITERKRFFVYCGYAWGVPALHVLGVLAIDRWAQPSSFFHPGIGFGQCFLKQGVPELLYFHGPMAILITINIILFAITAFKIRAIKKDTTSVLKKEDSKRHSYENDKQTFNLYLKLLFAMGVNWSMEIISWAVNWAQKAPDSVWYLTDFCNAIYGVFIFFIFVFKKNIWKLLKKRYYSFIGKPHLAHSMTVSNTTRATSYSTANTMNGVTDTSTLTSEA